MCSGIDLIKFDSTGIRNRAAALVTAIVGIAVVARGQLAAAASVLGAFLLLAALIALVEAPVAAQFSESWTPNRVLLIGLGMLVGGGVLGWLGWTSWHYPALSESHVRVVP